MSKNQEYKDISINLMEVSKRLRAIRIQMIRIRFKETENKTSHLVGVMAEIENELIHNKSSYVLDDLIDRAEAILNIEI